MPKPADDIQDLKRRLVLLEQLDGPLLVCAEGLHRIEVERVKDAGALVAACRAGRLPLAAVRAAIELSSPPFPITPSLLAAAQRDLRVLAMPHVPGLVREAPRLFRRRRAPDAAWIAEKQARLARLADAPRVASAVDAGGSALPPWFERTLELVALVYGEEAAGAARAAALVPAAGRDERERLLSFLAHAALCFDPRPRGGGALAFARKDLELSPGKLRARFEGVAVRLPEALALARLKLGRAEAAIARLVAGGLSMEHVERLADIGRAPDLAAVGGGVESAAAYAEWTTTLLPHYRSLGLDLPLTPELFQRLPAARKGDLAVLAMCLMKHHTKAEPDTAEEALARLDATLALFSRRPADVASILAELSGTTPGAGRERMPEIAAWLGDDALLDRYVHLARLAGAPADLSRTLRADFERGNEIEREREHLAGRPSRTPEQQARLARLLAGEVAVPGPERTRRRLAERVRELLARAYEARLDAVLRRIAREAWGLTVKRLTPAFRDAIRFYLVVDDNRELLATVLRTAASGADLARALPRNKAWIASVAGRFDVEAWLAPRACDVTIGGERYRLAVERDPLEVLRMGIPFDTCLSLEGGCNAASTVVNAADANKRVLYLRDGRGKIVARKLVAVSRDLAMIGYRLYVAANEHKGEITAAFRETCARMAADAGLRLAASGRPKQIHPGFWYDDGAEPFDVPAGDVSLVACCEGLGVPVPSEANGDLRNDARVVAAMRSADEEGVCAALAEGHWSRAHRRAAAWLVPRLSPERLVTEARRTSLVAREAVRRAARSGPLAMLRTAGQIAAWACSELVEELVQRSPMTPEIASALVDAALAASRAGVKFDHHGIEHRTLDLLPFAILRQLPIAAGLALCDRVEPLWRWLEDEQAECKECVQTARWRTVGALEAHHGRAPEPAAVIQRLGGRSGLLARRAALAIAARYPLAEGATRPVLPLPRVSPLVPCPAALRALEKLRRRAPELEGEPDLLAALLRQGGGPVRGVRLPVPGSAPFEALADLLVQLDLSEVVAPWTGADIEPRSWKPGPWELYHHRRAPTGLRGRIAEEARAAVTSGAPVPQLAEAAQRLARLGDVRALAGLLAELEGSGPEAQKRRAALERARAIAAEIAGQMASSEAPDPMAAERARRAKGRPKATSEGNDVGLCLAATAVFERHLEGGADVSTGSGRRLAEPVEGATLDLAHTIIGEADGSVRLREELFGAIVARRGGRLGEAERGIAAVWLRGLKERGIGLVPAEIGVAMLADRRLRPAFAELVAKHRKYEIEDTVLGLAALAERTGGARLAREITGAIVSAVLEEDPTDLFRFDDEALFRRAVRTLLDRGIAARVVNSYSNLGDHGQMAAFLRELAGHPLRETEAMRAAVKVWRESSDPPAPAQAEWMEACLAGALPASRSTRSRSARGEKRSAG